MYKLGYCWKCEEENKTRHNTLCFKLPVELVEKQIKPFNEYHICNNCTWAIRMNKRDTELYGDFTKNKTHYLISQIIRKMLDRFLDVWTCDDVELLFMTRRDYRNIIKQSQHPLKKQMLKYISKTLRRGKDTVSFLNSLLLYEYPEKDFTNISCYSTGEDKEIVKTIFLVLFDFLQINSEHKYNITEQELRDYLEAKIK